MVFEKNSNLYNIIGISVAISLFGLAIVLNYFPENFIGILGTVIGCVLAWICALYVLDHQVEPLDFTGKGIILVIGIFFALYLYLLAILLYFQLTNLSAILTSHALWICISLPLSYLLIENITPVRPTSKEELLILLIITLLGLVLILTLSLNNYPITCIIAGTCILVYLFWVIVLSKVKPPKKRIID